MEPTPFSTDIETVDAAQFPQSGGATGRLDFLVWLLERRTEKETLLYRDPKLLYRPSISQHIGLARGGCRRGLSLVAGHFSLAART